MTLQFKKFEYSLPTGMLKNVLRNVEGTALELLLRDTGFIWHTQKGRFALKRPSCLQLCFKGRVLNNFLLLLVLRYFLREFLNTFII